MLDHNPLKLWQKKLFSGFSLTKTITYNFLTSKRKKKFDFDVKKVQSLFNGNGKGRKAKNLKKHFNSKKEKKMKAHKLHKFSTAKTLDRFFSNMKNSMRSKISLVKSLTDMNLNTRVEWYASHSTKETNAKNIFIPSLACYMSDPMAAGNSKLDKSILIFDLLAVVTCRNCKSCAATCYALKAQRMYANTLLKRSLNTWLAMQDLDFLFQCIENQIKHSRKTVVRIHSSGDFFAQIYVNKWAELIAKFPNVRFYAYTKVDHIFDFSKIESLKNFNLIRSILPDGSKNYGPEEEIKEKANKFHFPICPYRKDMAAEDMPHCGGTCDICLNHKIVGFVEH